MSKRMWTDRSVVYLVRAGKDFRPQSPWDCPASFTDARLHAQNLPLEDARAMVRSLNKGAVAAWETDAAKRRSSWLRRIFRVARWDRRWAVCVACARSKGWDRRIRVVSLTKRSTADQAEAILNRLTVATSDAAGKKGGGA